MNRPGFSFIICPDPEIVRERVDRLLSEAGTAFAKEVYWGDEDITSAYFGALTVQSLFSGAKAVVLRRAEAAPADFWPKLAPILKGFNASVWPFFCLEGPFEKKGPKLLKGLTEQPYYKVAVARKWVFSSAGLTRASLAPLLSDWASARGLTFAPGVAERLAGALPTDMAFAGGELEKLSLALGERTEITADDLSLLSYHEGIDGFAFLDALSNPGAADAVWRAIADRQLAGEEMIFPFIGLLLYEARILWRLACGEAGDIRLPPFVLRKKEGMARKLGVGGLATLFELAFSAELGIKSGSVRPDQAMEFLTAELSRLFSGNSGQRGRVSR